MSPKKLAGLITARREAAKMTEEELARRAKLSRGDCGIVAACMCALWKGIKTTPDEMIHKANLPIRRLTISRACWLLCGAHL